MIGIFKVLLWKYGSFFFPFQKDRCKYTVALLFKVPSIEDRIYKCCSTSELLINTLINWSLLENHITKKTFISAGYQHKWLKVGQSMLQKQVTSSESSDPQTHKKKKLPVIPVHFHTVSSILWFAADTLQEALQDPECPAPTRGQ